MSLHFIFGRAGTGKTTRCCREIQDYLKKTPGGRAYLLVPDQGTYTAEYLLAKSFPGAGFIDVTVCGFSRLAYRVFKSCTRRSPMPFRRWASRSSCAAFWMHTRTSCR